MAYERPAKGEPSSSNQPPDPATLVKEGVLSWMHKRGKSILPAPCPPDPDRCVTWWLARMQEPQRNGETTLASVAGTDERGWDEGYAKRCRNALLHFLDMAPVERNAVVAGVVDDSVPYRGDDFAFYRQVHEETMHMREIGVAAYRERAKRAATLVDLAFNR